MATYNDQAKKEIRPLAVVFVNFAKAFDSVSHKHIAEVLSRKGVDEWMRRLIQDAYNGCTTVVRTKHGDTDRIHIKVGVKQGDPLSPQSPEPYSTCLCRRPGTAQ
ncbi:uncharacterized protein AKAME5_002685900 [Lates japonicus]|uniref:Reverse transcriptase domain-containing protein n=1 Tax=Lates japonicus TaxID=270547 RepID=A0AAD3RPH9_LATJO|nr:uncharacterized protein AKAME5_002685900 [Lates japonicus]